MTAFRNCMYLMQLKSIMEKSRKNCSLHMMALWCYQEMEGRILPGTAQHFACTNQHSDGPELEAAGKSPNMERIAFQRALDFLMTKLEVSKIVTDAHPQISATMKRTEKYKSIKHQFDIWHGSKNLGKKLSAASQQKNCSDLQPWIRKIGNHFWHSVSSQTCQGDSEKMVGNFAGVLHHVVNEHEWLFTLDGRRGKCDHEPIEESQTPWMTPGSPPHEKLWEIVMDKRFLKSMPYYEDFLHTGNLESFHSTHLM